MSKTSKASSRPTYDAGYLNVIIGSIDKLAAAGVRVLEVGEGATRVRVELEPRGAWAPVADALKQNPYDLRAEVDLIRQQARGILQGSARAPVTDAQQADPTEATRSPGAEGLEDAEQAGDELDLAHLG